jgi:G3E family GTPase
MERHLVPVTILTGFLGAGKTTLLNRILTERHGLQIAVIENEFGEVGIDNDLLIESEELIVEMNNGCICCRVRGDLTRILGELAQRRQGDGLAFDRVMIETTGLADPAPVAQTFFVDDTVREHYRLDGIVTVVDARHAMHQLDTHHEAQEQVAFADRLVISKTDLVAADLEARLRERLRGMNPRARIDRAHFGETSLAELLDIRGFDLDAALETGPDFLTDATHEHDDEIGSFVYRTTHPARIPAAGGALRPSRRRVRHRHAALQGHPQRRRSRRARGLSGRAHALQLQGRGAMA